MTKPTARLPPPGPLEEYMARFRWPVHACGAVAGVPRVPGGAACAAGAEQDADLAGGCGACAGVEAAGGVATAVLLV